jgi:hypothetical protein
MIHVEAPWAFLQQYPLREIEVVWIEAASADRWEALEGPVNFVPEIVAGECDMSPRKRCDLK